MKSFPKNYTAVMALVAAGFTVPAAQAQVDGSNGVTLGGDSTLGRISAAETITDISDYGVGVFPQGWRTPFLDIANLVAPVSQFTGVNNDGTNVATLDLIPLRTTSLQLVDPITNVITALDGKNIYNSDGALNGNRTVTMGNSQLAWDWGVNGNMVFALPSGPGVVLNSPAGNRAQISRSNANLSLLTSPSGGVPVAGNGITILNNGNVGLNDGAPGAKLSVYNTVEDISGLFVVQTRPGTNVGAFINLANTPTSQGIVVRAGSNTTAGASMVDFRRADNTPLGSIVQNSTSSIQYLTTSDERLKTEIKGTHFSLDDLMKIEVKDYFYKGDSHQQTGFIAQQIFKVYPQVVDVGGEDPLVKPWQVDYSKLTPLLTKAVQDLNSERIQLSIRLAKVEAENAELKKLAVEMKEIRALVADLEGKSNATATVSLIK